jgi:CRISPR system Cascade subunit CasE
MLYLTRFKLKPSSPVVRRAMQDSEYVCAQLMGMFPDLDNLGHYSYLGAEHCSTVGLRWRIEPSERGPSLLVQSTHYPDIEQLHPGYGPATVLDLDRHLDRLTTGQKVNIRLIGNAVKRINATRRIVPLFDDDATAWWERRAAGAGLEPIDTETTLLAPFSVRKGELHRIKFDAIARISDIAALRKAVTLGVGRGRPYGCGMLSVVPV